MTQHTSISFRELLSDDGYAATFQTMGQYRTALLAAFPKQHARAPLPVPTDIMVARAQGRAEALAIILNLDAEEGLNDYTGSHPIGDTGEYGSHWDEGLLRELLRADDTAWSLMQEAEGEYWHNLGLREEADRLYARSVATVTDSMALAFHHQTSDGAIGRDEVDEIKEGLRAAMLASSDVASFQARVKPWMLECFGAEIAADQQERNHRFLEEALELVQACGATASEAHQLVDYVYGRPVGEKEQEAGGVMVTLAALCLAQGMDMHGAGETELARIWTKVEQIRAKQAAKPKHSPLPQHETILYSLGGTSAPTEAEPS